MVIILNLKKVGVKLMNKKKQKEKQNAILNRLNRLSESFDVKFERDESDSSLFTVTIMRGLYVSFSALEVRSFSSDSILKFAIQYRVQNAIAETLAYLACMNVDITKVQLKKGQNK